MNAGIKDLWGDIIDLHQEHFMTIDATNVSLLAGSDTVSGIPSDVFRVLLMEPRTLSSSGEDLAFRPKDYNHPDFIAARQIGTLGGNTGVVFYQISAAGAPVGSPIINVAPRVSTTVLLRFVYIPTLPLVTVSGYNPIPGESDKALEAWTTAFARSKDREDRMPDPAWLAVYATEKAHILTRLTPRQEQEEEVAEGFLGY
jgi:hypothetical protein